VQSTVNGNGQKDTETRVSSRELAADVMQVAQRLVSLEIALAKQELREIATTNIIAAACMAAAGLIAILAVLVALPVLVVVAVPWHWEAALAWAIAYILIAAGLALYGRSRLSLRLPTRTIESLKENKEWALHQLRSTKR
jgi:cytochrome c biogenesis protein CcdA